MPIEVLKKGEVPSEKPYVAYCQHCKSELRFKEADGKIVYDQRDGDYLAITCPICSSTVATALKPR